RRAHADRSAQTILPTLRSRELAQHVVQNAAVPEIFELVDGIDAAYQRDPLEAAVGGDDLGDHALARLDLAAPPADRDLLVAQQAPAPAGRALLEAERKLARPDQVGAMDAPEQLADDRADAEQVRTFRRPVARGAAAVLLAGEGDERHVVLLVAHGRIEDR